MPKQVATKNNKSDDEIEEESDNEIEEEVEVDEEDKDKDVEEQNQDKVKVKIIHNRDTFKEVIAKEAIIINNEKQELKELEKKYKEDILKRKQNIKIRENNYKELKQYIKLVKSNKSKSNMNTDGTVKLNQFTKPQPIPNRFKDFYEHLNKDEAFLKKFPEFDINSDQAKTNITKIIYHYIQTNVLYEMKPDGTPNKCVIIPDNALTKLFMIENGETIGFSSFKKYEKRLYDSDKVSEEDNVEVETKKKVSTSNN